MTVPAALADLIVPAWTTNARVTESLVRALPLQVYRAEIPGRPRRTVQMLAAHIHNSRCGWLRTLGSPLGIEAPGVLQREGVGKPDLVRALKGSARAMERLFLLACERDGHLPATSRYVWRNLALDLGHLITYFIAHEAHHRGQLLLIAQQLGTPVAPKAADAVWWWKPPRPTPRGRKR